MLYLRLAALAAFLAIVGMALWYRSEAISAEAARERIAGQLATVAEVNRQQQATIERITRMRQNDDRILSDLTNEIARLTDVAAQTQESVTELEKTNENVRAYLAGAIPDDLRRVLNNP